MRKLKKHTLAPYPMNFQMIIGQTALQKECKKRKIPAPDFSENLGACARSGSDILIYVSDKQDNFLAAVDTIIHESVHAFQALVDFIAEAEPSDEFAAYTTAHIATTLIGEYTQYIEETNALHEGRKEGLCSGEQGVQLETRAAEEQVGTDSGSTASECSWSDT